jgi:hypothetical protein
MPSSFTATPGSLVYPANQSLIYTCSTTASPIPDDFRFVIQVFEFGTTQIGIYYLAPNSAGKAHFDLSPIVRERVQHDTFDNNGQPLFSNSGAPILAKGVENSKGYQVRIGSYTGGSATLNEANTTIVVIDGAMQPRDGLHPGFTPYYPLNSTRKVWLTSYPLVGSTITIPAMDDDDGAIGFLYNDVTGQAVTHVRTRVWNGGTIVNTTFTEISTQGLAATTADEKLAGNALGYIKGYPKLWLNYIGYTGAWTKISHILTDSGFNPVSSTLDLVRYCEVSKNENTRIAFSNAVGGWDFMTFTGLRTKTYSREAKQYKPIPGTWDSATFALPASIPASKVYHMDVKQAHQVTKVIDLLDQPLVDMLARSKQVFATLQGQYLPIRITNSSMQIRETANARAFTLILDFELQQEVTC